MAITPSSIDVAPDVVNQVVPASVRPVAVHTIDDVDYQHMVEGLVPAPYDYISATYPTDTQEIYVYKLGGASGDTIATVTIDYTDDSKEFISTVERS